MNHKLALDFGTTNSVIAHWNAEAESADILSLMSLSSPPTASQPPIIPSLVYVHDGQAGKLSIGQSVLEQGLTQQRDNRLFRNFKRGIVASPAAPPRQIDDHAWTAEQIGEHFLHALLNALPFSTDEIEQLVITAPVSAFQDYIEWLSGTLSENLGDKIRLVDESTAAALGYMVTQPGAMVLVFDFGGGTLDVSLVELPEHKERVGGFLSRLLKGSTGGHTAQVIAKGGRVLGGSDIDQWLLEDVLQREQLTHETLGESYNALLTACESLKIALSEDTSGELHFEAEGKQHSLTITRAELESLLEKHEFYAGVRRVLDRVLHTARQRGIFKEDIHAVLLVGGMSLMPSVQALLKTYFGETAVRADKPFAAVAEGALQVALGYGLQDYLIHSYGLRHLDPQRAQHEYDEIIPMGSPVPLGAPVEVLLGATHEGQTELEFVIAAIDSDSAEMIEVEYEGGQAVFVASASRDTQQIIPLNADAPLIIPFEPSSSSDEDRFKAVFTVDDQHQLRLTVTDLKDSKALIENQVVTTLR